MPCGHFSHVADVSGLSALTLALTAHAKTNVRLTLPIPTCGCEVIVPDFESLASCLLHSRTLEVLGNVWFPDPKKKTALSVKQVLDLLDLLVAFYPTDFD